MKPKYVILILGFITTVFTVVFIPSPVSAVSSYDNVVYKPLTDNIKIKRYSDSVSMSPFEFGQWLGNNVTGACEVAVNAIGDGHNYAIVQQATAYDPPYDTETSPNIYDVYVYVDIANDLHGTGTWLWQAPGPGSPYGSLLTDEYSASFRVRYKLDNSGVLEVTSCSIKDPLGLKPWSTLYSSSGSSNPLYIDWVILTNTDISYPENYEGDDIPQPQPPKEKRQPKFAGQISNKSITAIPYAPEPNLPDFTNELDEGYHFVKYFISWTLWNCDDEYDEVTLTCNGNTTQVDSQNRDLQQNYEYDVSSNGNYTLQAEYWVEQCYRYPSYPDTPDYCFYSQLRAHFNDEPFEYVSTSKIIKIDGSTFSFDIQNLTCDVAGRCYDTPTDCETIDGATWITTLSCRFDENLNFGLISPSLSAIRNLLTSITVSNDPQCLLPLSNQEVLGRAIPLSNLDDQACAMATEVKSNFPFTVIIINAIYALVLVRLIIGAVNKIASAKSNNLIEGL